MERQPRPKPRLAEEPLGPALAYSPITSMTGTDDFIPRSFKIL
jgi:hypothetical protein